MVPTALNQDVLEDAIARVKGICSCQVVVGGSEVDEIHAIGTMERSAKQIVRDIETLMRVRFGVTIDYRKISLVQLDDAGSDRVMARPRLHRVDGRSTEGGYLVTVAIEQQGKVYQASIEGGYALTDRLELAARTTASVISLILGRADLITVGAARLFPLDSREVAAVTLVANVSTAASETLVGVALIADEDDLVVALLEAAARAVLCATNRRLPILLSLMKKGNRNTV